MNKMPHPLISLIPLITLIGLISASIWMFGSDALLGSSQISLLFSTALCIVISTGIYKYPWKAFEEEVAKTIGNTAIAIIILLLIGMLSASWMLSGIVPTLIYHGIHIISPKFFLFMTCLICALVSVMTGSSWTTIATIGVALMGMGEALGISVAWTAGAIISGAYFGDKISPLSDTTILASSSAGTELFTHIRYMLFTTIPSFTITLIIFFIAGLALSGNGETHVTEYTSHLASTFNISLWTLIIPIITAILILKKVPSPVTLFASSLMCAVCALILQRDILFTIAGDHNSLSLLKGIIIMFSTSTTLDTGSQAVNDLVATNGMSGMLNTVWLIVCAMIFGSVMVASQMLQSITMTILKYVRSTLGLVSSTIGSGLLMNIATGDQFLSIIITANMYKKAYKDMNLENRLLSRTTEDGVTVTSVLIPWNTCGLTQSTVLGVSTLSYLPFCFFNYISPLMSILIASTGWKIYHTDKNMAKK